MKPRSINIFLLDGDPNGIRVAQIMMSTIQAIAFRRNKLGDVCKTFHVWTLALADGNHCTVLPAFVDLIGPPRARLGPIILP
ncbi:hypothetical protein [Tabrizicola soli]|uniref:DNA topoisomerase (ATP-hydrolyzing) n=1 Tax=Tabrizicola soli TaxID=2185115 RepID=A0ABV7DYB1_9RHOB|nr:hypothetical protein [Tabrizicola soli]